jgi:DNA-binding IclR family transcriptional regulator
MSTEIALLRALLLFSRRSAPPTVADLLDRVGCDAAELERVLATLERAHLVQRTGSSGRLSLSLSGLAVAVAAAATARRAKTVARPKGTRASRVARVIPMRANVRRGRAA